MRSTLIPAIIVFFIASYAQSTRADVLYLNNGSLVAGMSRANSSSPVTHVLTLTDMVEVQNADIQRVETTAVSLRNYKKLLAHLDLKKARCLNMAARWCRHKGLYDEMFRMYDTLAVEHPADRELGDFIYEMSLRIQYKGFDARSPMTEKQAMTLLQKTAGSPSALEKIGESILLGMAPEILADVLIKSLKAPKEKVQIKAIDLLARLTPEEGIIPLIKICIYSRNNRVRESAQRALTGFEHEGIIYPFLKVLKSNTKTYRMNALSSLAMLKDPRTAGALIANLGPSRSVASGNSSARSGHIYVGKITSAVTGFEPEIANSAAIANPKVSLIQDGVLLDVTMLGTSSRPLRSTAERRITARTLKSITGMDYGDDYLLWKQWWKNNRTKILKR